jgi:hypothetical protein
MKINDEVIYQVKRWQVVRIVPQVQVADYTAPRVPDQLRLWGPATGEAIWASADAVIVATSETTDA